jgi:hypothetical protein
MRAHIRAPLPQFVETRAAPWTRAGPERQPFSPAVAAIPGSGMHVLT